MRFERKIKYLDYLENGERVRSGGFLKLETGAELFKMELTVKGVRGERESVRDVILCGNGREAMLGKIEMREGQGEFRYTCRLDLEMGGAGIGETGIACDELAGVRIPLGEGREAACIWESQRPSAEQAEKPARKQKQPAAQKSFEEASERPLEKQKKSEEPPVRQPEKHKQPEKQIDKRPEKHEQPEKQMDKQSEKHKQMKESIDKLPVEQEQYEMSSVERKTVRDTAVKELPEAAPLKENKWLQLCAIYPHINPFQDQREYLSIGPEDFVLLSEDSYRAAGNSFMLHGYYNYRHLILAREERRGEILYYVGVPGNYYDREKQVAVMFGFESFECAQEPAQSSDFGYYMMRVKL